MSSSGHYQKRLGKLDEDDFYEMEAVMSFWLSREGTRRWWEVHGRQRYNRHFVAYIEELVRAGDSKER